MSPSVPGQTDPAGLETLELFAEAPAFNQWLFDNIVPYCTGIVMEIGSGIGNISRLLLQSFDKVALSDLREEYCAVLHQSFDGHPALEGIHQLDLSITQLERTYPSLLHHFDTVVALNVVEHIQDDARAIANCRKMLKPGGHLIVLVPAGQQLYNGFDEELGHFKRYNRANLSALLEQQDMKVEQVFFFNLAGIAGWWFTGSLLKKRIIPQGQLKLYNKLIPLFRLLDKVTMQKIGLSVIAVAKRTS